MEQPALSWAETKAIVFELEALFSRSDDRDDLKDIIASKKKLEEIYDEKLNISKKLINEMTARVEQKERELRAPEEARHAAESAAAQAEDRAAREALAARRAALGAARAKIEDLEGARGAAAAAAQEAARRHAEEIYRLKHQVSLYAHTTNLKWDYTSENLAGVVAVTGTEEVRDFEIDPTVHSKFEIANQLWDIVDPPHH